MKKRAKLEQGSVLFTVLAIMTMMMVLISATITFVAHTNKESYNEYYSRQAYFTASSCLESFVTEVTKYSADGSATEDQAKENIEMLQRIAASGEVIDVQIARDGGASLDGVRDRVGTCTLKVEENGSNTNLKATATATYLGVTESVTAYFTVKGLTKNGTLNNAIELIGTTGAAYNNMEAYGNVAASDIASHTNNTKYDMTTNNTKISGAMTILGSVMADTHMTMRKNPLYSPGDELEEDQSLGGSITVSRSLFNTGGSGGLEVVSELSKARDNNDPAEFNYVNAGEMIVMGGTSTKIGSLGADESDGSDNLEVDLYSYGLVVGSVNTSNLSALPAGEKAMIEKAIEAYDSTGARADISFSTAQGQGQVVNGNVYTYDQGSGSVFNGDIYITGINNTFNGDIYCSGDIYVNAGGNKVNGNIYLMPGKSVKGSSTLTVSGTVSNLDWASAAAGRSLKPAINSTSDTLAQYVYFPEHMMCSDNEGVSSIDDTYASFYDASDNLKSDVKYLTDFAGGTKYGMTFDHIVTSSCVMDYLSNGAANKRVLIDLDDAAVNADSRNDIVIIMKNNGFVDCQNILIKNSTTEDDKEAERFCYFVSDSGVGTVNDEYKQDMDANVVPARASTYDSSTFKVSSFTFENTKIMDFDTYINCSLYDSSKYLNFTTDTSLTGYNPGPAQMIMLLTEGSSIKTNNQCLLQASIYAPRAVVTFANNQRVKVQPYTTEETNIGIIGMVIVSQFNTSANNVGVFFQKVSENSVLKCAKGSKAIYTSGFKLSKYANY